MSKAIIIWPTQDPRRKACRYSAINNLPKQPGLDDPVSHNGIVIAVITIGAVSQQELTPVGATITKVIRLIIETLDDANSLGNHINGDSLLRKVRLRRVVPVVCPLLIDNDSEVILVLPAIPLVTNDLGPIVDATLDGGGQNVCEEFLTLRCTLAAHGGLPSLLVDTVNHTTGAVSTTTLCYCLMPYCHSAAG